MKNPELREDDNRLYEQVLKICEEREHIQLRSLSVKTYFERFGALRAEHGIPTFETVCRVRRKAQKKDPTLKPRQKVEDSRQETQVVFEQYAVS